MNCAVHVYMTFEPEKIDAMGPERHDFPGPKQLQEELIADAAPAPPSFATASLRTHANQPRSHATGVRHQRKEDRNDAHDARG